MLDAHMSGSLSVRIEQLFQDQLTRWPQLRDGVEGLTRARSRELDVRGFRVRATHIPHRIGSTTAQVDAESIRQRPCFLCSKNLPDQQRTVGFGRDFAVAYNPYPILEGHLTIVLREHSPQRIEHRFATMLKLATELPGYVVLYNGPECGASAPDHMHFQACRYDQMPLIADRTHASKGTIPGYPRSVFVLQDSQSARLARSFSHLLEALTVHNNGRPEPMVNLVALHESGRWTVFVFPRAKHRPEIFHSGQLTWTPGTIDLCGVVVLPVASDLDRITSAEIEQVFSEVSLDPQNVEKIAERLELP
jgi:hypothetical protein